jgi:hypothetical protein
MRSFEALVSLVAYNHEDATVLSHAAYSSCGDPMKLILDNIPQQSLEAEVSSLHLDSKIDIQFHVAFFF